MVAAMIIPETISAQSWGGRKKAGFWDNWSVTGQAGLTSFFGDLSIYDSEIMDKFTKESGPAMGAILSKHFNEKFSIGGQLLYGTLKAENTAGRSFESTFLEYNFQANVNLVNVLWPYNMSKMGFHAYGGIGQFMFNTTSIVQDEGSNETLQESTSVPEFVYFMGMGLSYKFTHRLGANVDMSLRQAQNDKIDAYVKNDNFDYYTLITVGVTYYIDSFKNGNQYSRRGGGTKGRFPGRLPMRRRR